MAVALSAPGKLNPVGGVRLSAGFGGIKKDGSNDLVIVSLADGSSVSGVFTNNAYCAAPVMVAREHLAKGQVRALLINSGNANAGTGVVGHADAISLCDACAAELGINCDQVLPFSTGVIGETLPVDRMKRGISDLLSNLEDDAWLFAAQAIMTTDTIPKAVSRTVTIDGREVEITGMSKGSGMIHPNMATMLGFVATDALVDSAALDVATKHIADKTFNCITVDGDTSTNDAFITMATGAAGNRVLDEAHPQWQEFLTALHGVSLALAHAIIRDGEGATKFVEIEVSGGASVEECREVALTVAHSPLVKTAFFASDPNLGRILMAIGRSKVDALDISKISLALNDLSVVAEGEPSKHYDESKANIIMANEEFKVSIGLGRGSSVCNVWTTDLSYEYVKINAEYRT